MSFDWKRHARKAIRIGLTEIASDQGAGNSTHIKSIYHGAIPNPRHSIQYQESAIPHDTAFAEWLWSW